MERSYLAYAFFTIRLLSMPAGTCRRVKER